MAKTRKFTVQVEHDIYIPTTHDEKTCKERINDFLGQLAEGRFISCGSDKTNLYRPKSTIKKLRSTLKEVTNDR